MKSARAIGFLGAEWCAAGLLTRRAAIAPQHRDNACARRVGRPAARNGAVVPGTFDRCAISLVLLAAVLLAGCGGKTVNEWFRQYGASHSLESRVAQVESPKADERREALTALASTKETRNVPSVVKIFCLVAKSDKDVMVRDAAVRGLAEMEGEEVVATLSQVVTKDKSPYVRREAVISLARRVSPEGAPAMIQALRDDSSADVRLAAAENLYRFREKAAAEALAAVLEDTDIAVVVRAWEGLRYMTGQDLPRLAQPWNEFLASADDPFALYGKPLPPPRGTNQRPTFTRGPRELIRDMLKPDVREGELK